jgi:hypothetical protein
MIDEIRAKIAKGNYEFSKHAVDQSILRDISIGELVEAINTMALSSKIIPTTNTAQAA